MRDRIEGLVRVRAGELVANPGNWRTHPLRQRKALEALLAEIGYADALLARRDKGSLVLIDGHLRQSLDPDQVVPVLVLDVDEAEANKLLATLDPLAGLAGSNDQALRTLLGKVSTSSEDLRALLADLARRAGPGLATDPDAIPIHEPRCRLGDLWSIGEHKLICADATSKETFARLMGKDKADCLITDPPYGVSYQGRTKARLRISNDEREGLSELLSQAFGLVDEVLAESAPIYVFHPAGEASVVFLNAFCAHWSLRQGLVWQKDRMVLGRSDYHYAHEPIAYGYKPGKARSGRGGNRWYGGNAQTSLIQVARPAASTEHPTMKPVELLRRLLANSARRGDRVLDPFAGSGSSLIACEIIGAAGRGIEIDPRYCDVALARLEAVTGAPAEKL